FISLNRATYTGLSTRSLHDALPIYQARGALVDREDVVLRVDGHAVGVDLGRRQVQERHARAARRDLGDLGGQGVPAAHAHVDRADRKSTRLNSSHVKISYAVFCLKK